MKELTIEQKVKRYNEALKKAYQLCSYPTTKPFISDLQDLFPELKESEDERIRKVIYGWIYTQPSQFFDSGFSKEEMLAWLEKQGEQKHILPELKESEDERIRKNLIELLLDVPSQDIINHHLSLSEVLAWIEKHEWKPSDIQIKALKIVKDYIVFNNWNDCVCNTLKNLLEQLKKL